MNYADEDYVRLYVADTVTWKLMSFEAQTVLLHMLKGRFDRSGVFEIGCHTPSRAVTAVTKVPEAIAEVGVAELLESGTWVLGDGCIVWPRYVSGQTTPRTDKSRQRESRQNRAKQRTVTIGHTLSQPVTPSHTESQPVTLNRAEQSRAEVPPVVPPTGDRPKRTRVKRVDTRPYPDDLDPSKADLDCATRERVDLAAELPRFRDHHLARGSKFLDWHAALRTWLRNARKFADERSGTPEPQRTPDEERAARAAYDAKIAAQMAADQASCLARAKDAPAAPPPGQRRIETGSLFG